MGTFAKCCCAYDCLMPFACNNWTVSYNSYSSSVTPTYDPFGTRTTLNSTDTGDTVVGPISYSGTCSGTSYSITASTTWRFKTSLQAQRGVGGGLSFFCTSCPSPFPSQFTSAGANPAGMYTTKIAGQCYAVFSVTVYYSYSLSISISSAGIPAGCRPPYSISGGVQMSFLSDLIPYTAITDLQSTWTLYRAPPSNNCANLSTTYSTVTTSGTGNPIVTCGSLCFIQVGSVDKTVVTSSALPLTLSLTIGDCKTVGVAGGA